MPGELDRSTNTLKREGKLILDESDSYGVEMALQLVATAGGGEVSLVSMAPNGEVVGSAHRAGDGRGQGRARVSDPALQGSDALTTAKVLAAAIGRLGGADLVIAAHRVDRRLHRHGARADRRAARPAVGHVRQARRGRRRHAEGQPPDRGGLRRGRPARCRPSSVGHRRRRRAAVPELQGDHGGQVEAGRHGHRRRPRRRRRSAGPAPASRSSTSTSAEARKAGEIVEDDGEGYAKIVAFLENLKVI